MTRPEIRAALSPVQALTCTLFGEVRGAGIAGVIAVGCVIRNRADHPRWWGADLKSVCLAKAQFSCWWEDPHANTRAVYDLATAFLTGHPLADRSLASEMEWVARGIAADVLRDVTHGADHYLTTELFRSPHAPIWARGKTPVHESGGHTFLRLEL